MTLEYYLVLQWRGPIFNLIFTQLVDKWRLEILFDPNGQSLSQVFWKMKAEIWKIRGIYFIEIQ